MTGLTYLAPMAGLTHPAFRRVVARLGGCDVFTTEMLSARALLRENLATSPYTIRAEGETRLVHQVMLTNEDPVEQVIERLGRVGSEGLDINLACHAPRIRAVKAGSSLFLDEAALADTLGRARESWSGRLTVKIRLGSDRMGWEEILRERLALFERIGIDGVTVHARFFEDKYKRRVRHELFPAIRGWTRLPLIANGELHRGDGTLLPAPEGYDGIMAGRMAVVRPWMFRGGPQPDDAEAAQIWREVVTGIGEVFPGRGGVGRARQFTLYFARNYLFGHGFAMAVRRAADLEEILGIGEGFFARDPARVAEPNLAGLA